MLSFFRKSEPEYHVEIIHDLMHQIHDRTGYIVATVGGNFSECIAEEITRRLNAGVESAGEYQGIFINADWES